MKKITIEHIREQFTKEGYTLLSEEYIGAHTKLDYRCSNGHEHSIRWYDWKYAHRCPSCAGLSKPSLEDISKSFKDNNCILLSKEYINNRTKLYYICSNGHEHSIRWRDWSRGQRCPTCYGNVKPTINMIKESFSKENYILLSKNYINNRSKLNYECPNGHKHSISWHGWDGAGNRCPYCSMKIKKTIEDIKISFEKEGYILLTTEYKNSTTYLDYICPVGHKHSIRRYNWSSGIRCPVCANINNSGSNNSSWKGGISYEPYCPIWSDKEYKKDIKLRDGNKCLNPTCNKRDSRLNIHHIDYNKKNCEYKNVITLCGSCNSSANKDREWHTAWYQALMYMRYNYKYSKLKGELNE